MRFSLANAIMLNANVWLFFSYLCASFCPRLLLYNVSLVSLVFRCPAICLVAFCGSVYNLDLQHSKCSIALIPLPPFRLSKPVT